jgi:hypothetical protein
MCALVAVGVHAAADVLGDRLLWLIDGLGAALDSLFGSFALTAPLVDLLGLERRTLMARGAALAWELFADALLALPMLGYEERDTRNDFELGKQLLRKTAARPTTLRLTRPICTAAVALAGCCSAARLLQGSLSLGGRALLGAGLARGLGSLCAVLALALIAATLGWRAAVRGLQHADAVSDKRVKTRARAISAGAASSALLIPLAVAALRASPLLSFFR